MHPDRQPTRHLVKTLQAATMLLALMLVLASCSSSRGADVKQGWQSPGGTRISLLIGSCNANPRSRVEETEREVRVRVRVTKQKGNAGDCADADEIILSEPLGDRLLIDEFDGEPVPVDLDPRLPDARQGGHVGHDPGVGPARRQLAVTERGRRGRRLAICV